MYLWNTHRARLREALDVDIESAIRFRDFLIRIEPPHDGVYPVRVESPAGEGASTFAFDPGRLPERLEEIAAVKASPGAVLTGGPPASSGGMDPAAFGLDLFERLFRGATRDLFNQSLGVIRQDGRTGLRIKLHVDPDEPGLADLLRVPWELLYRKEQRAYLAQSSYTPVVRHLAVPQADVPLPIEGRLRVLVVVAQPRNTGRLRLSAEYESIREAWGVEGVEFTSIVGTDARPATFTALQEALRGGEYHVLHFMGHGVYDEQSGQGALAFEGTYRQLDLVTGTSLGMLLRDEPTLRLVFLNACETGVSRKGVYETNDPFAGVASAIVMAGAPAVVAMQYKVEDSLSIDFARTVYRLLRQGYAIESAVTEGRKAAQRYEGVGWATPVLYMRSSEGVLFKPTSSELLRSLLERVGLTWTPELPLNVDPENPAAMADAVIDEAVRSDRIVELLGAICTRLLDALGGHEAAVACRRTVGHLEDQLRASSETPAEARTTPAEARRTACEALARTLATVRAEAGPDRGDADDRRLRACLEVATVLAEQREVRFPAGDAPACYRVVPASLIHDTGPVYRTRPHSEAQRGRAAWFLRLWALHGRQTLGIADDEEQDAPPAEARRAFEQAVEAVARAEEAEDETDLLLAEAWEAFETALEAAWKDLDAESAEAERHAERRRVFEAYRSDSAALARSAFGKMRLVYAPFSLLDVEAVGRWRAWIRRVTASTTVDAGRGAPSYTYQEDVQRGEGVVRMPRSREIVPNVAGEVAGALEAASGLPVREGGRSNAGLAWKLEEVGDPAGIDVFKPVHPDPEAMREPAMDLIADRLTMEGRRSAEAEAEALRVGTSGSSEVVSVSVDEIETPIFELGTWLYPFYVGLIEEAGKAPRLVVVDGAATEQKAAETLYVARPAGDAPPPETPPRSRLKLVLAGMLLGLVLALLFLDQLAGWLEVPGF